MKKVFAIIAVATMMIVASACGNNKKAENKEAETAPATEVAAPAQEETIQEAAAAAAEDVAKTAVETAAEKVNAEVTK